MNQVLTLSSTVEQNLVSFPFPDNTRTLTFKVYKTDYKTFLILVDNDDGLYLLLSQR